MKKILFIGAGFLQQFFIKRAKELNYYVLAIDGNENAVGFKYADEYTVIDIKDKDKCYEYAKYKEIDGVITGATDYGVITTAYIANKMNLPGLDYDVAKLIKNKYLVAKKINQFIPDSFKQLYIIKNKNDLISIKHKLKYPLVIKPIDGSGSRGVFIINDEQSLMDKYEKSIDSSVSKEALIQDLFTGKEYGADVFVYNNQIHIYGPIGKNMTQLPDCAELGHFFPTKLDNVEKIKKQIEAVIKSLGINFGAVNLDFLVEENTSEIHIIDMGARMGGNLISSHIIPIGMGVDYVGNLIKASLGENVEIDNLKITPIVTRILALSEGVVKKIPNKEKICQKYEVEILDHLSLNDEINVYKNNLDGFGYIIAQNPDINIAFYNSSKALLEYDNEIVREGK